MLKKIVLIFMLSISAPVFAIDRSELNLDFFSRFNDEYLTCYINQAFENNHDLKQAALKVEEYRQQVKYSFSHELPSLGVNANYLGIKVPKLDNFELQQNAFILPFMANYEADLLLKNRDKTKSTKKAYEAEKYQEKAVYIALLSDTASCYTNILRYDSMIESQEKNVNLASQIFERDKRKFERGVINNTELNNSEKRLQDAKNSLISLKKERDTLLYQFAVLCGGLDINDIKRGKFDNFEYSVSVPCELSSDIIFSRPDVMKAEKNLEKAKIDIRIARKEFLPRFNITGLWVFNTIAPGTFFSWESSLAMILAGASQDIFTGGRKVANLRIQKSRYEQLFEEYRQTDLEAVKEVNTTLCIIKHDTEVDNNTRGKLDLEGINFADAKAKYERGVISYPDYLKEAQNFLNIKQDNVQTKAQRLIDYITLYKTAGGQV